MTLAGRKQNVFLQCFHQLWVLVAPRGTGRRGGERDQGRQGAKGEEGRRLTRTLPWKEEKSLGHQGRKEIGWDKGERGSHEVIQGVTHGAAGRSLTP